MKMTEEQIKRLEPFEPYFRTALNANWARHPGQKAMELIHCIYTSVTGERRPLNASCQSCILHLLQDCGRLYYLSKAQLAGNLTESKKNIRKKNNL